MVRNLTRKEACPAGRNNTPLSETQRFYHKYCGIVKGEKASNPFRRQAFLPVAAPAYSPEMSE